MTSPQKSARIGAQVDRIHAEMATGVLSCPGASIAFGAGEPLSMTAWSGAVELEGDHALPLVAEAFVRHAGEPVMDGRATVRRRPGQVVPWSTWRERFMTALRSAELSLASSPPATPDVVVSNDLAPYLWSDVGDADVDRHDLPILPPGETAIRGRPMDATVDLDTWARLLGNGIITVVGPEVRGLAVVAGRTLIDAFAVEREGRGCCGFAARSALARAQGATVAAVHLDESRRSDALPALWRLPLAARSLDRRAVDLPGLLEVVAEGALDAVVEVSSSDGEMILVLRAGQPVLAYTADRLTSPDEFTLRYASTAGRVTVRLQEGGRGGVIPQSVGAGALSAADRNQRGWGLDSPAERAAAGPGGLDASWSERGGPDTGTQLHRGEDRGDHDRRHVGTDLEVPWERLAAEATFDGAAFSASEDGTGECLASRDDDAGELLPALGGRRGASDERAKWPVASSVAVARDVAQLVELRREMASIAGKLGGQAPPVLAEIEAAESHGELATLPDRLASLVPHPAFRRLCERVAMEMRSHLAAT
jgi:hypothetical protein